MSLDDLEVTIQPLLAEWSKSYKSKDFGDFVNDEEDSFVMKLLKGN